MKYEYEYNDNKFRTYLKRETINKLFKTEKRIYLYTDIYRNNIWNTVSKKDQTYMMCINKNWFEGKAKDIIFLSENLSDEDFKNHLIGLSKEYIKFIPFNDEYKDINISEESKQKRLSERLE